MGIKIVEVKARNSSFRASRFVHILIASTAGPVLNSSLQLYLAMNFFFARSVIELPVLLGILRPMILACLSLTAGSLTQLAAFSSHGMLNS